MESGNQETRKNAVQNQNRPPPPFLSCFPAFQIESLRTGQNRIAAASRRARSLPPIESRQPQRIESMESGKQETRKNAVKNQNRPASAVSFLLS